MPTIDGKMDNGTRRNAPPAPNDIGVPVPPEVQADAANASPSEVVAITRPGGKNTKKTTTTFIAAAGLVVLMIVFIIFLQGTSKKHTPVAPNSSVPDAKQAQQPASGQPAGTPLPGDASVPNEDKSAQNQNQPAVGTPNTSADELLKTRKQQQAGSDGQTDSGGTGSASTPAQNNSLGGIKGFVPPAIGADGTQATSWTPPAYGSDAARSGGSSYGNNASYHKQVAQPSMIFVQAVTAASSSPADLSMQSSANAGGNISRFQSNFGYAPGYHMSAKLEIAASTATNVPVIAVIGYDYRKDGILIVPAGSRAIGTLQQATGTGIVGMRFTSIRLPSGEVIPVSAVGLDTHLGSLKGIVSGRNLGKQFLTVALAGLGQSLAMFGGSNNSSSISQTDMVRAQLSQNIGSAADQTFQQLSVGEHLVVTVPAGTPLEVTFIDEAPQTGTKTGSTAK